MLLIKINIFILLNNIFKFDNKKGFLPVVHMDNKSAGKKNSQDV